MHANTRHTSDSARSSDLLIPWPTAAHPHKEQRSIGRSRMQGTSRDKTESDTEWGKRVEAGSPARATRWRRSGSTGCWSGPWARGRGSWTGSGGAHRSRTRCASARGPFAPAETEMTRGAVVSVVRIEACMRASVEGLSLRGRPGRCGAVRVTVIVDHEGR